MLQFGGLIVETPAAGLRLLPDHWDRLESAATWAAQGFAAGARRIIAGLEADLAREANLRASAVAGRAARKAQMAVGAEAKTTLPDAERGHTAEQVKRFDKLKRKQALPTLTEKQRDGVAMELATLERAPAAAEEADALVDHLSDVLARAEGPVEIHATGRLRLISRDGLESLMISGALTPPEHAAGMRYRGWVEDLREPLGSQMGERTAGSPVINVDGESRAQQRRTDARNAIMRAEAVVKAGANGRRIMTLRQVAGLARTIASLGGGGATRARNTAALQIALQILADHWGLT